MPEGAVVPCAAAQTTVRSRIRRAPKNRMQAPAGLCRTRRDTTRRQFWCQSCQHFEPSAAICKQADWQSKSFRKRELVAKSSGAEPSMLSAQELELYARHIVLREVGGPGQAALKQSRVLVVGAGGLGAPGLLYLAAAGVGALRVVDDAVAARPHLA